MGLRMQPQNGKFFTLLSKAGSNVVESAAILREFFAAPHERWAAVAEHPLTHAAGRATFSRDEDLRRPDRFDESRALYKDVVGAVSSLVLSTACHRGQWGWIALARLSTRAASSCWPCRVRRRASVSSA
jgi:hypothetical protein